LPLAGGGEVLILSPGNWHWAAIQVQPRKGFPDRFVMISFCKQTPEGRREPRGSDAYVLQLILNIMIITIKETMALPALFSF
jgi:hypothetical protein